MLLLLSRSQCDQFSKAQSPANAIANFMRARLAHQGAKPARTYPKMLIANTKTIVEQLGGKYTQFK